MQNVFITPHDHLKWISEINKVKKKADVSLIDFVGIN